MKLKYFGTCAAEGFPGMFCSCEVCEKARKAGGRNIRTRSQSLVDGKLLIDFSADTYLHVLNYGLDLRDVEACIITHGHSDHLYPEDFIFRINGYAYFPDNDKNKKPLDIYSTFQSGKRIRELFGRQMVEEDDPKAVKYHVIKRFETYDIAGYEVTPLRAHHAFELDPVTYIIAKDGKYLLFAHDTGYFPEDTWEYIENSGIRFDFVSLDCTCILENTDLNNHHMGLNMCSRVKERLLKKNADEKTVFCVNHFSHNGGLIYDELVPEAEKLGFIVSYDSMEVEF